MRRRLIEALLRGRPFFRAGGADPLSAAALIWGLVAYARGGAVGYGLALLGFAAARRSSRVLVQRLRNAQSCAPTL